MYYLRYEYEFLATINRLELTTKHTCEIRRLVAHSILVNGREFVKSGKCHVIWKIVDHAKYSFVEWLIDMLLGLDILVQEKVIRIRNGHNASERAHSWYNHSP
jgi:hypothetical protein